MSDVLVKIRMSNNDLKQFKKYIENCNDDLSLGVKRKRKLSFLLDEDYKNTEHSYKVFFTAFSRIDGLPMLRFENTPNEKSLKELLINGEVIDYNFKEPGDIELELIKIIEDN